MKQILFASDMDNTLIFSYKHKKNTDICVEILDEKEQGFITAETEEKLSKINQNILFIPVTTRSVQQYSRIKFPKSCIPEYAVTTNGAILLENGNINKKWLEKSKELVKPFWGEIHKMQEALKYSDIDKRYKIVDDMYLYAAYDTKEDAQTDYNRLKDKTKLNVCISGRKVYFFPPEINKGFAVERLKNMFKPHKIISAGDSIIDVPMICKADIGVIPESLANSFCGLKDTQNLHICNGDKRFCNYVLDTVSKFI